MNRPRMRRIRRKQPDFSDFIGPYPPDSPNPRSICFLSDRLLEQPNDLTGLKIDVDVFSGRMAGQAGHGAHVADQRVDEARAHAGAHFRIGRVKPVGAPLSLGSWERLRWVLAMQMGRLPKPLRS